MAEIEADDKAMLDRALRMTQAHDADVYGFDLLAGGAVNRSLALSAGFCMLIRNRNLICAGALLRLHLDTALRFFAGFIVEKPHDFAIAVLEGKHVRKMTDQHGQMMTDRYLVKQLAKEHPWIERVYERTSGYIHMSAVHILSIFDGVNNEDRSVGIKIGSEDKELPDTIYLEAIEAFRESTKVLGSYVDGWTFTKANPEAVAEMREARQDR